MPAPLPAEVLEKLKFHCESNRLGMMMIAHKTFTFILMGDAQLGPDQTSLLAASALLQGLINGAWSKENEKELLAQMDESGAKKH